MSEHTPSVDEAGCSDACVPCARAAARELDALRDLRAMVLRADILRGLGAPGADWAFIVAAARKAVTP